MRIFAVGDKQSHPGHRSQFGLPELERVRIPWANASRSGIQTDFLFAREHSSRSFIAIGHCRME